jgi:tetratricopeptide (TPR) repeat protein
MPLNLNNLGLSFQSRFVHTENFADISKAISYYQKGVHLTPDGHAGMPLCLNNLGLSFQCRFVHTEDPADISEAISYLQKVVDLTPDGHVDMPIYLNNLGLSFESRFEHTGDLADIHKLLSIVHVRQCATYSSGPPSARLKAALKWAQHSSYDPLEAYNTAIQLVSQVAGLEQTIRKRHTNLLNISDLVSSAVSCAFKFQRFDLALEWLEQGRCLIWNQLNNLRTPLDILFVHNSALKSGPVSVLGPPGLEPRTGPVLLYSRMSEPKTGTEENRKKPV